MCVGVLVIRVSVIVFTVFFVLFRLCIFILICYWCKDYCHRVTTQLIIIIIIIINRKKILALKILNAAFLKFPVMSLQNNVNTVLI